MIRPGWWEALRCHFGRHRWHGVVLSEKELQTVHLFHCRSCGSVESSP